PTSTSHSGDWAGTAAWSCGWNGSLCGRPAVLCRSTRNAATWRPPLGSKDFWFEGFADQGTCAQDFVLARGRRTYSGEAPRRQAERPGHGSITDWTHSPPKEAPRLPPSESP